LSIPTKATRGEVIKILDDNKEDIMNEYGQEEVLIKIKPEQLDGTTAELANDTRRYGRTRIVNK
jgi:hypothetical protein